MERLFCRPLPCFQLQVGGRVAATLDHEIGDHPVDQRAGVVAFAHVTQEVRDRERRAIRQQLDDEFTHVRRDLDLRGLVGCRGGHADQ
jgi:hypothetical protein